MRISYWSSDVCSSDLRRREAALALFDHFPALEHIVSTAREILVPDAHRITARVDTRDERGASDPTLVTPVIDRVGTGDAFAAGVLDGLWSGKGLTDAAKHGLALAALKHGIHGRSEEHTSELQSLMRISYAV